MTAVSATSAELKFCPGCDTEKTRTEFHKNKHRKDGLRSYCKECSKVWNNHWLQRNRDWQCAYQKDYRKRRPEFYREIARRRLADEQQRTAVLATNRAYYARRKAAQGSFTPTEWEQLCKQYGFCCAYCKQPKRLTRHHIVPLSKAGTNWINNIAPACQSCNSSIGTKVQYPER